MNYTKTIAVSELAEGTQKAVTVEGQDIALFHHGGKITALCGKCPHKGGPLADGNVEQGADGVRRVVCPWHGWQFDIATGDAPEGSVRQAVHDVKIEDGMIAVSVTPSIPAVLPPKRDDPLADLRNLAYQTTPTSLNVLGISTTNMGTQLERYSTSEAALEKALQYAAAEHGAATRMIKLRDLGFRHCEGYYSHSASACTWPCSIMEQDAADGMGQVYRDMVLWADVVLLATPIRWGNASSLYYKMAERLNCVQNQITLNDSVLIQSKVASFIVTGGQDNIQAVVGQLSAFFTDLGFAFPPFNFVGWSRGWIAEDMENNVAQFKKSRYLARTLKELVSNSVMLSRQIKGIANSNIKAPKPHVGDARLPG
jgi:nitrite reductase/ring-hydroxylating ferredoxin subunit/multimeric flavodoxin WrbA